MASGRWAGRRPQPALELAEAEEHGQGAGRAEDGVLGGRDELLDPLVDPERTLVEDDGSSRTGGRQAERGRQPIGGDRAGRLGPPGGRAVEEHGRAGDAEPPGDLVGHRGRRGEDARSQPDEPALAPADERPERARQLDEPGRFRVQVGDVVDEAAVPSGRPANRGAGHREGDQRLRVDHVGAGRGHGDRGRPRRPRGGAWPGSRARAGTAAAAGRRPRARPTGSARGGPETGRPEHGHAQGAGQRAQPARRSAGRDAPGGARRVRRAWPRTASRRRRTRRP